MLVPVTDSSPSLKIAMTLHQAGKRAEAEQMYRQLVAENPRLAEAWHLLGVSLHQRGEHAQARPMIEQALAIGPPSPIYWTHLGIVCRALHDLPAAEHAYRQVLALTPGSVEALNNLGNVYCDLGRLAEAKETYRRALTLRPDFHLALNNLGKILQDEGDLQAALPLFERATTVKPEYLSAWTNLANNLLQRGQLDQAEQVFRGILTRDPNNVGAAFNLGNLLQQKLQLDDAYALYQIALAGKPDYPLALGGAYFVRQQMACWDDAASWDQGVRDAQSASREASFSPYFLLATNLDPSFERRAAEQFARRFQSIQPLPAAPRPKNPRRRIGYLSADFREHSMGYLMGELFEQHDPERFETLAFSIGPQGDSPLRQRFRGSCSAFVDLVLLAPEAAARRIQNEHLDLLVDLNGYTSLARPQILAYRPAPVQIQWLGYPGTMGASFIDHLFADDVLIPAGDEGHYAEKVVRLPGCYQINDRQRHTDPQTPTRAECGLPATGVVFANFNQSFKIQPAMFAAWMRIVQRIPGSVLWLLESNPWARENLRTSARAAGVDPARLVFAPPLPNAQHLARYRHVDLVLDTFPYTSHSSGSDALWMGCPLVTLVGDTFASRVAGSLVTHAGVPELATKSLEAFETLAVRLAENDSARQQMQARLVSGRATSTLFDTPRFVRGLEAAYEAILS